MKKGNTMAPPRANLSEPLLPSPAARLKPKSKVAVRAMSYPYSHAELIADELVQSDLSKSEDAAELSPTLGVRPPWEKRWGGLSDAAGEPPRSSDKRRSPRRGGRVAGDFELSRCCESSFDRV